MTTPARPDARQIVEAVAHEVPGRITLPEPGTAVGVRQAWELLCAQLKVGEWEVAKRLSRISGLAVAVDLDKVGAESGRLIPFQLATALNVIPLRKEPDGWVVAVGNPFDTTFEEDLRFALGGPFTRELAPPQHIELAVARAYANMSPNSLAALGTMELGSEAEKADPGDVPQLARLLLSKALARRASDLHIQPFVGGSAARARIDGMLQRLVMLPDTVARSLIRYFKVRSGMDSSDHLRPQDGRMTVSAGGREIDLRLSTLPSSNGEEKLVIRFLNRDTEFSMAALGLSLDETHHLRAMAASPSGVILVCGPTGSGKSTTLYSILSELNTERVSISTVENPVEVHMPGLSQTEVKEKAGMTFAAALRSVLRQDPDIILVGEIRDRETAEIAMQSALTGHLVFSTLHTRSGFAAVQRLENLDIDPVVLSEALVGVVSQRLLRKLCEKCREPIDELKEPENKLFHAITKIKPAYRAAGCEACDFTGYSGRLVVTEMFDVNTKMSGLIAEGGARAAALREVAGPDFRTMSSGAARRIISGETSAAEAARVLGRTFWAEIAEEYRAVLPDLSKLSAIVEAKASGENAVLLVGRPEAFSESLRGAFKQAWYRTYDAAAPEDAKRMLKEHSEIGLVLVDVDDAWSADEAAKRIAAYRKELAWSRLPALLLIKEGATDIKEKLIAEGATSRFLYKSVPAQVILRQVHTAFVTHADFNWGR